MSQPTRYGGMRRFRIERPDFVAQGIVFSDGTTVVRWFGERPRTTVHASLEQLEAWLHNHATLFRLEVAQFRWEDPICFNCGVEISRTAYGQWCSACGAVSDTPYLETRPNASSGRWATASSLELKSTTLWDHLREAGHGRPPE